MHDGPISESMGYICSAVSPSRQCRDSVLGFQEPGIPSSPNGRKVVGVDLYQSRDCCLLFQSLLKPDCLWQDQAFSAMKEDKKECFPIFQCQQGTCLQS